MLTGHVGGSVPNRRVKVAFWGNENQCVSQQGVGSRGTRQDGASMAPGGGGEKKGGRSLDIGYCILRCVANNNGRPNRVEQSSVEAGGRLVAFNFLKPIYNQPTSSSSSPSSSSAAAAAPVHFITIIWLFGERNFQGVFEKNPLKLVGMRFGKTILFYEHA
ncbi:hypothetical protein T07_3463 [Trichinella nelsoni]|uniref:Uncharacterized protein n=1 Tax=Trichinella nelsoni TaxID=6336 RepID=A0A0V0S9F5_9BILA|nr:hypothetical protein T07_3463 [Trichinella nelsoni]